MTMGPDGKRTTCLLGQVTRPAAAQADFRSWREQDEALLTMSLTGLMENIASESGARADCGKGGHRARARTIETVLRRTARNLNIEEAIVMQEYDIRTEKYGTNSNWRLVLIGAGS